MLSICINSDFPIQIRPIDPRTDRFQPRDDVRRWMTEWIAAPAADERDLWTPRFQQLA